MSINIAQLNAAKAGENLKASPTAYKPSISGTNSIMTYPSDIRSQDDHLPLICFTAYERNPTPGNVDGVKKPNGGFHQVYFPAIAEIAFADGASYGSKDLGIAGGSMAMAAEKNGTGAGSKLSSAAGAAAKSAQTIVGEKIEGGAGDYIALNSGKVVNPNTNTAFENNNIRSFSFSFKLVAKSQDDSKMIKDICEMFRFFTYADLANQGSNLFLSYPAVWTIRYMDMNTGTENPYIPGIYSCYLKDFSSTFNSTAKTFYADNAPLEVDISLSFQETRVLNRNDIITIKDDPLRGIINGKPSVIGRNAAELTNIGGGD